MATATWSYSGSGAYRGDNWNSITLTSVDALPSNATITDIRFSIEAYYGATAASSSSTFFKFYGIAIDNGPYIASDFDGSKPTTALIDQVFKVATDTTDDSFNTTTKKYAGYNEGEAKVWRDQQLNRTYCRMYNSKFDNQTVTDAFHDNELNIRVLFYTNSSNFITYLNNIEVTVTYILPTITAPTNISITQNNNGTYTLNWDPSTGVNGIGEVTYSVLELINGNQIATEITATNCSAQIPSNLSITYRWHITAYYSGVSAYSEINHTFQTPYLVGASNVTINRISGDSVTISWNPGSLYYTQGKISYSVYCLPEENAYIWGGDTESTSFTLSSSWFEENSGTGEQYYFQIATYATELTYNPENVEYLEQESSLTPQFTYDSKYTIGYYKDGKWQECVVYYYDGSKPGWVECIPYYYDNSQPQPWVPIKTKTT